MDFRYAFPTFFFVLCSVAVAYSDDLPIQDIHLPPGYKIEVFASGIDDARSMVLSPKGVLFVGTRENGQVYALTDENGDHRADRTYVIAKKLNMPNGVAFREGALYVAEVNRILRYDAIEDRLSDPPEPVVVRDDLPDDRWHGWKYLALGPDDWLYFGIGAPCNVCRTEDPYATIMRMQPDGRDLTVFARGVRNTVGFDWHPRTQELWFTDNGRDMMGDDLPPDELDRAHKPGLHFGFPACHGKDIKDPSYNLGRACSTFIPPVQSLAPHTAALGMKFYDGTMFPENMRGAILIAEHGSWNRTEKIGYRVTLVKVKGKRAVSYEPFAEGWLRPDGTVWGRPVDVLVAPDGSVLVSDDYAGGIYRISYEAP